jgi:hypothetical protein
MTLERRIIELERRCRALGISLAVIVAAGALVGLAGASANKSANNAELRVSRLEVVDQHGKVRIVLGATDEDQKHFEISMNDGGGIQRAVWQDTGRLRLTDGKTSVMLNCADGVSGLLVRKNDKTAPSAFLHVGSDYAGLQLRDDAGRKIHDLHTRSPSQVRDPSATQPPGQNPFAN